MSQEETQIGGWIRSAVARFEGPLVRYAAHITGDLERGRDVVQETFLQLCRQDPSKLDGYLAEWLFTVCRNQAMDVKRKENRMKTLTHEQASVQKSKEVDHETATENRDTAQHILKVLGGLSDNQQEVVRLKFQAGLSYQEISRVTDLSVSNVGYLIHTAIQKIRKQLRVDTA